ncbi:MAG: glutathione S-transferase N-terminal domain-containing protein, partial [Tistlia sp.]
MAIETDVAGTLSPIRLHDFALSGHAHRVRLFLSLLGLPLEIVPMGLAGGAQKRPAFLAINAFGQVPVIEDPNGAGPGGEPLVLADSNAILVYLAGRYDPSGRWLPREPLAAARVQRWLSVAAGQLNDGAARARILTLFGRPGDL